MVGIHQGLSYIVKVFYAQYGQIDGLETITDRLEHNTRTPELKFLARFLGNNHLSG